MVSSLASVKSQLTLQSRRRVLSDLDGEFSSLHTGVGTDFHDLREYVRGDDVKHLDWKASARTGGMLVRRFSAVRKHTVVLAVSTGRTMAAMHSLERTKGEVAGEVAALVGWLALRQSDSVGVAYGDAAGHRLVPPRAGEAHTERALTAAASATLTDGPDCDTAGLLRHLTRSYRQRAILLVVCDDLTLTDPLRAALRRAVVQHDVLAVTVGDLDPTAVPDGSPSSVDVATAWQLPAWVRRDPLLTRQLLDTRTADAARLHTGLAALGVVHEHLATEDGVLSAVRRLLLRHRRAPGRH